jgi:ribosomal-protein-alanine N-acetyltransferase
MELSADNDAVVRGPNLHLRTLRPGDANPTYLGWLHDPLVTQYLEVRHQKHTAESLESFVTAHLTPGVERLFAICLNEDDRHIGNIKLGPIDWRNLTAETGLLIGDRNCWGRGLATEAIALICRYAFEALRLRRIHAGVYAANHGSLRAFEKCGFVREGLLRGAVLYENEPMDVVLLGRFASDP